MQKGGLLLLTGLLSLALAAAVACGGEGAPTSPPQATPTPTSPPLDLVAKGKELYLNAPASVGPQALWCVHCHTIQGVTTGLVGPDHTQIGRDAVTRVPGMSAEEYLRESLRQPELRVAEGVERAIPGLMTTAIIGGLRDEEVDALVAFLLTLQ